MYADQDKAAREGSLYFDERTILAVEQRGGGGAGIGGENGLAAVNLVTGESTNEVIDLLKEETQEQAAEIDRLETANEELESENNRLLDANAELTEELSNAWITSGPNQYIRGDVSNITFILPTAPPVGTLSLAAGHTQGVSSIIHQNSGIIKCIVMGDHQATSDIGTITRNYNATYDYTTFFISYDNWPTATTYLLRVTD